MYLTCNIHTHLCSVAAMSRMYPSICTILFSKSTSSKESDYWRFSLWT